ncbi:hypothetical protein TNCV_4216581 [Trichonephila clavipes]|nr:hypothetical protein TNCV_4216581 [Trichonephila clavipes]
MTFNSETCFWYRKLIESKVVPYRDASRSEQSVIVWFLTEGGQESTLAITYAVLFQLQACSPPDELYAVGHYHPGKQRNLQWLQRKG